jgi:peptidoglycan/xylan/chitin deacetylase (PgdA/CDA1 family)
MTRSFVVALTAIFLTTAGIAPDARAADTTPVATILCYHEVDDAPTHTTVPRRGAAESGKNEQLRYTASRGNFRAQLDYLTANDYSVIPFSDLVDHLAGRKATLPPRAVVITVDDGWACAYSDILPEMQKRGMPFTLFAYPKIVGRGTHAVTWEQLSKMAQAKGVEIGSHSFTHPFLTLKNNKKVQAAEYDAFLKHELLDSRTRLQQATGKPVRYLCYPFGDYDASVASAASTFGYEAAVTTERGVITRATPLMQLKRYLIHNDTTLEQFKTFLLP